jgi:hypothetical protein
MKKAKKQAKGSRDAHGVVKVDFKRDEHFLAV